MKRKVVLMMLMMLALAAWGSAQESLDQIVTITSFDGAGFDGRLRMPQGGAAQRLVIFVNGSGPNTYDNRRDTGDGRQFLYHDLFAKQLNDRGAAYFSYNTRGVTPGDQPPLYCAIDEAAYQTYLPSNEIEDVACIIKQLKQMDGLEDAQVALLGWSAGAIIAPQVALRHEGLADMLVLAGYPNGTMAQILDWQQTGGASMVFYRNYFDTDGDGAISRAEYEADPYQIRAALGDLPFEGMDLDGDGAITAADFAIMLQDSREQTFAAFERGDDQWLKDNYPVPLTSAWYMDYQNIEPNGTALLKLDLPIRIFQGIYDQNTPVEGARAVEQAFRDAGKTNLAVHIYEADHDLNYMQYVMAGTIPQPIQDLLDACVEAI